MNQSELNQQGIKHDTGKPKYHLIPMRIANQLYTEADKVSMINILETTYKIEQNDPLEDEFTFCVMALGGYDSALKALADVYTFGAEKHGDYNWMCLEDGKNRFISALMRHINAWKSGEMVNKEDGGVLHLAQIMFNIIAITYYVEKDGK